MIQFDPEQLEYLLHVIDDTKDWWFSDEAKESFKDELDTLEFHKDMIQALRKKVSDDIVIQAKLHFKFE